MQEESYVCSHIEEAVQAIRAVCKEKPESCIVLGSGLSPMAERCDVIAQIPFSCIPHFSVPTTPGHDGVLIVTKIGHSLVYIMKGRFHYYEGFSTQEITFPLRVFASLGVRNIILTNAAGGLHPGMKPGDLMVIRDHLSFNCDSPLRGPNLEEFGPRFPDQTRIYHPDFIASVLKVAEEINLPVHVGVYAYMRGPQFETPSEIKALRMMGADAVGMSTVPEVIVASHCGMRVLAISCITNLAAGTTDVPLSHAEVIETGAAASDRTIQLIEAFLKEMS